MMIYLTHRYHFSAGHRLHNEALSAEENRRLYGKCNNPNGHGHNYQLEVTLAGPVDPATGMVCDLALLDRLVDEAVLTPFDHRHLNLDVEAFRTRVPTTENLCLEIFGRLAGKLAGGGIPPGVRLAGVRLEETSLNFFESRGEGKNIEPKVRGYE